ncbi:hypothetical protein J7384_17185 [Endozoicomonas sp. G2_1]|uniref:hypothetical protein n=1 Tax=Endozoicomonas sp. G2_1 TaxID=2821091 RepID=UPI001AD9D696|nr:hypothetical protein [Endozoicomonas sp. G2_1]MBO9492099.1 hypothetical protein [Endozoicomonas sp. G2_1]
MVDAFTAKKAQEYHDTLERIMILEPDLDIDELKENIKQYCLSSPVSVGDALTQCYQSIIESKPMPWEPIECWRDLQVGEKVQVGDRFYSGHTREWVTVTDEDVHIRKVTKTTFPFQRLVTQK